MIVLFVLLFAGNVFAADVAADFTSANQLYSEGKFGDAAAAYQNILSTGVQSPALLFNAGNAEFKSGHLGRAIAAYRQAGQLSPRDAGLRANLAFVRNQVQGPTLRETGWQSWSGLLTLNEGALLTAICFWAMLGLLTLRQLRPALAPRLRGLTQLALVLTVLSWALLAVQAAGHFSASVAIVTGGDAAARSGPFNDAQNTFTAHDGAELRVLDRHDDWVQAANGTGQTGWLNLKQVKILPGA